MDIAGWEQHYRAGTRGGEDQPTILLVETVAGLSPGRAIDLACGAGRNALFLVEIGWEVTAVDGSASAIEVLRERACVRGVQVSTEVADLTAQGYRIASGVFDLILVAYYLQRDLIEQAKAAIKPEGVVVVIVHTPEAGEPWDVKRAAPGELRAFFSGWQILHDYEGPSRDPAHRRPVAEIVACRS